MNFWTNEEIESILLQLETKGKLFKKYTFLTENGHLKVLGHGASAIVYEVKNGNKNYALKVIGFDIKYHMDSEVFSQTMQKQIMLSGTQNIVKIIDYKELVIRLEESDQIVKINRWETSGEHEQNCLKLQFVLMEKAESIIQTDKGGRQRLSRKSLMTCDEAEILKLAMEVGEALQSAHNVKILHRDVKLENVFYSLKQKKYKLGDFGIAKVTHDNTASTVAFTKGYGAPEVVSSLEEVYDNTADIYSFGMMLYVLLNDFCFPESGDYSVNVKAQYSYGYVVPRPKHGSEELCKIVEKMCMYNPDDRYQSMDEVLLALASVVYDTSIHYKKKHRTLTYTVGTIALFLGMGIWNSDLWEYRWLALTAWSFSGTMFYQNLLLYRLDKRTFRSFLEQNRYWIFIFVFYSAIWLNMKMMKTSYELYRMILGSDMIEMLQSLQIDKAAMGGMILTLLWIGREWIMTRGVRREKLWKR